MNAMFALYPATSSELASQRSSTQIQPDGQATNQCRRYSVEQPARLRPIITPARTPTVWLRRYVILPPTRPHTASLARRTHARAVQLVITWYSRPARIHVSRPPGTDDGGRSCASQLQLSGRWDREPRRARPRPRGGSKLGDGHAVASTQTQRRAAAAGYPGSPQAPGSGDANPRPMAATGTGEQRPAPNCFEMRYSRAIESCISNTTSHDRNRIGNWDACMKERSSGCLLATSSASSLACA